MKLMVFREFNLKAVLLLGLLQVRSFFFKKDIINKGVHFYGNIFSV
jgi:hypothetical protein